jgi:tryptophanyl-tRNA synthetase
MPTDPARVKLTDAGDPEKCPVWQLHKVYSDEQTKTATIKVAVCII